ncbi:MAG: hypothetical protein KDK23_09875 [Leptospiraceae bacterium]|nr:hypothetical protein [Leptospiraceae bacterium]
MAGYLFIGLGCILGSGMVGRAIMGFMGDADGRSPWGYLALAWLMIICIIVGRIILKMRGDAKVRNFPVSLNDRQGTGSMAVPGNWTGLFAGWIFFGVGSTFAMLALSWLPGTPIYGKTLILGIVSALLGAIVLVVTLYARRKARGDARKQRAIESKPFAMLGLIVAALVGLVFYALGIIALLYRPGNWAGALVFWAIPSLGLIIFLSVRRRKKAHRGEKTRDLQ